MVAMTSLLLRNVRVVPFHRQAELAGLHGSRTPSAPGRAVEPLDLRIVDGVVVEAAPELTGSEKVLDAEGGWVIPGLWDAHVHLDQEAAGRSRIDTTDTTSAEEALALVAERLRAETALSGSAPLTVQAAGHRLARWPRVPTVAELDAVTGDVPPVLASGDFHSGWLNSAALRILGMPGATPSDPGGPVREDTWFGVVDRLDEIPGARELRERGVHEVLADAVARGVTGLTDMSWIAPHDWPGLLRRASRAAGAPTPLPRIRSAVYPGGLEETIAAGLRTGDAMPGSPVAPDGTPLITRGPLKVISDGSLGTATARLTAAYPAGVAGEDPLGVSNIDREDLTSLLARAHEAGYEAAIHAIGDAAVEDVAAAFEASGAAGRIEHAQLVPVGSFDGPGAFSTLVRCGIELSVQPAHLIDDWPIVDRIWPGRRDRAYAFGSMIAGGARLALGSDAPVAHLDPWLAMSVATGRLMPDGAVWSPSERLSVEEALASSVDGAGPVGTGSRADLVILDVDPLELDAEGLSAVRPLATLVGGAVLHAA